MKKDNYHIIFLNAQLFENAHQKSTLYRAKSSQNHNVKNIK